MNGKNGFTYPAALLLVVVVSISLMVVQRQWSTIMKREREKELFFRAEQIMQGIESYYLSSPDGSHNYPKSFKALLKDNRFLTLKRHLRRLYEDPLTEDGEWGIVYDGQGGIKGVFSRSSEKPMKTGGFSKEYEAFEKRDRYSDWKFVYDPKKETT